MNRDELMAWLKDTARIEGPFPQPEGRLTRAMHYLEVKHLADHLLPLIEQERRTAQVEVLRRMATEEALRWQRGESSHGWQWLYDAADRIEREGSVDRKTTEEPEQRQPQPGAGYYDALPLLTEEEVGELWNGWMDGWRDWDSIVDDDQHHEPYRFANACIAKANEKAGHSATEPSAEPIRLLIETHVVGDDPRTGRRQFSAESPDVPGWIAIADSLTELVQLIKEGVPFALGVEGPVPFTLMDSYGEFGGDAGPDSKSSITDHSEPSAEPDFTDGSYVARNEPEEYWIDALRWFRDRENGGVREREPREVEFAKVSSPIRVKVTTETRIEKVDE